MIFMIQLVSKIEEANAITHAGSFHADDIFATIFLSKMQDIYLYRANEITGKYPDKIIFDIGYGEFDHHGNNARIRENGIKYSSFGLLFEKYGKKYLKQLNVEEIDSCYEIFLKEFIMQIDAIDNGVFPSNPKDYKITTLSGIIELFNKTWKEEEDSFLNGLFVGELIYNRIEKRIIDKFEAKNKVEEAISKCEGPILILDTYLPFMDFLLSSKQEQAKNILFAIFPSNRGGYNIRAIEKSIHSHEKRREFPKEWGGKSKDELVELTGISSIHFCHINLFLCACETLEDAKAIAQLAIK